MRGVDLPNVPFTEELFLEEDDKYLLDPKRRLWQMDNQAVDAIRTRNCVRQKVSET